MGMALTSKGQAAEALSYIRTGMRLDPNYPETFLWFLGQALFSAERYEEAAVALESAAKLNPNDEVVFALLGRHLWPSRPNARGQGRHCALQRTLGCARRPCR